MILQKVSAGGLTNWKSERDGCLLGPITRKRCGPSVHGNLARIAVGSHCAFHVGLQRSLFGDVACSVIGRQPRVDFYLLDPRFVRSSSRHLPLMSVVELRTCRVSVNSQNAGSMRASFDDRLIHITQTSIS